MLEFLTTINWSSHSTVFVGIVIFSAVVSLFLWYWEKKNWPTDL